MARLFRFRIIYVVLTLFAGSLWSNIYSIDGTKPNIVVILTDDQGYADISFNPYHPVEVYTPNMDSLAREGIFFSQAYTSGNTCSPTRAGLMLGKYQHRVGIYDSGEGGDGMPLDQTLFPQYLSPEGYVCGAFGKWHLGLTPEYNPISRGFNEFYGFMGRGAHDYYELNISDNPDHPLYRGMETISDSGYLTNLLTDEAIDFIQRHKAEPFFCYLAYNAVHSPAQAPAEDIADFDTGDSIRNILMAMLRHLDHGVGEVVSTLKEEGLWENTILIFLTDNGGSGAMHANNSPLRDFKQTNWEGGIRTPFVFSWPAKYPGGRIIETPIISLDILPTVLDAVGVAEPADNPFDGKSILPLLDGGTQHLHDMLFWTEGGEEGESAVRYGKWKLLAIKDNLHLSNLEVDTAETTNLKDIYPDTMDMMIIAFESWLDDMAEPKKTSSKRWSPALDSGNLLTLWDGLYYNGNTQNLSQTGIYNSDSLTEIGNNSTRSMVVAPGYDATIFREDSIEGDDMLLTSGVPYLGTFDNSLSSLILYPEGGPGTGSIEISASLASETASNTMDGDLSTYWDVAQKGSWIKYSLCRETSLKGIRIAFKRGHRRVAYFDVDVSVDGINWTPVIKDGSSSGTQTSLELFPFPEIKAKHIRITGYGNSDNSQNHYTEVEFVYVEEISNSSRIEAEDYSQAKDVAKILSDDCQGWLAIDAIIDGGWAEYSVNLPTGASQLDLRMKILQPGSIDIKIDQNLVQTINIDATMVNSLWQTLISTVNIPLGEHILGLNFKSEEPGSLCQVNWLETSGIADPQATASQIYFLARAFPNPFLHELNISSFEEIQEISVFDNTGRMVLKSSIQGRNCTLPTSGFSSGIYFIRIQSLKGVQFLKVIKS